MRTDIKNFPRLLSERDLLYLIWLELTKGGGTDGGSSDGSSDDGSGGCECLAPMVVDGTVDESNSTFLFTPSEGEATFAEALAQMEAGGLVFAKISGMGTILFSFGNEEGLYTMELDGGPVVWSAPVDMDDSGGVK